MPRAGERLIKESTGKIKSFWKARERGRKWEKNREREMNMHTEKQKD